MEEVSFKVSARSAQLIGRENISTDFGALIELIKNSYDADARKCIIYVNNKFTITPYEIKIEEFEKLILDDKEQLLSKNYTRKGNIYFLNSEISVENKQKLNQLFRNYAEIYLFDNGEGMDKTIIKEKWMFIGTTNKKYDYETSEFKRIKTGAKGIGRFALDKLGEKSEMFTFSKKKSQFFSWKVNWKQFEEKEGAEIGEIKAQLDEISNQTYFNKIKDIIPEKYLKDFNEKDFKHGTVLKISSLNSFWTENKVDKFGEELEKLNPPIKNNFDVYLFSDYGKYKGEIKNKSTNFYDYKLNCNILDNGEIKINIHRNEFDLSLLSSKGFFDSKGLFNKEQVKTQFEKVISILKDETIKKKYKDVSKHLKYNYLDKIYFEKEFDIIKNISNFDIPKEDFDRLKGFDFTFYFIKNIVHQKDIDSFCFKYFAKSDRKDYLDKFSGIKIYRDNFKVRPYGELNSEYFDWLLLDNRSRSSPAGLSHPNGDWRIDSNQVIGNLSISRVKNNLLIDTANREGLEDNDEFNLFKILILKIISIFEEDRQIMGRLIRWYIQSFEDIEFGLNQEELDNKIKQSKEDKKVLEKIDKGDLIKSIEKKDETIEDLHEEVRTLRGLATLGLGLGTYTHELNEVEEDVVDLYNDLKHILKDLIPEDKVLSLDQSFNPYLLLKDIEENNQKIKIWISFILNKLRTSRKKLQQYYILKCFEEIKKAWEKKLNLHAINIKLDTTNLNSNSTFNIFLVDIDSLFSNLIINSVDSFARKKSIENREINIIIEEDKDYLYLNYSDNGAGIDPKIKDANDIFKAQVSTKKNNKNEEIGIGLGMWIVDRIITDYSGERVITQREKGFSLKIILPKNKIKYQLKTT